MRMFSGSDDFHDDDGAMVPSSWKEPYDEDQSELELRGNLTDDVIEMYKEQQEILDNREKVRKLELGRAMAEAALIHEPTKTLPTIMRESLEKASIEVDDTKEYNWNLYGHPNGGDWKPGMGVREQIKLANMSVHDVHNYEEDFEKLRRQEDAEFARKESARLQDGRLKEGLTVVNTFDERTTDKPEEGKPVESFRLDMLQFPPKIESSIDIASDLASKL